MSDERAVPGGPADDTPRDRQGAADAPAPGAAGDDRSEPPRSPLSQAWDIARYAPIGLLFEGPYLLPKLAEMGKVHVRNARVVGELAVRQGRQQLRERLEGVDLDEQTTGLLKLLGVLPDAEPDTSPGPGDEPTEDGHDADRAAEDPLVAGAGAADRSDGAGPGPGGETRPPVGADLSAGDGDDPHAPAAPAADQLAIPDYESLSAPQVVSRLPGLSPEELEAVRSFETAHRGRKTILGKVAQLQHPQP